jgi:hypothetical protein
MRHCKQHLAEFRAFTVHAAETRVGRIVELFQFQTQPNAMAGRFEHAVKTIGGIQNGRVDILFFRAGVLISIGPYTKVVLIVIHISRKGFIFMPFAFTHFLCCLIETTYNTSK